MLRGLRSLGFRDRVYMGQSASQSQENPILLNPQPEWRPALISGAEGMGVGVWGLRCVR